MLIDIIITLLLLLFILGLLVFVHEFGHFIAAKLIGVEVEEFAFGFGKALWTKEYKETVYRINLLPLGGYVKILGDEDPSSFQRVSAHKYSQEEIAKYEEQLKHIGAGKGSLLSKIRKVREYDLQEEEKAALLQYIYKYLLTQDPNSFDKKNFFQKLFVFVAGVLMNMFIAVFIFTLYLSFSDFKTNITYITSYPFIGTEGEVYDKPVVAQVYSDILKNSNFYTSQENQGIILLKVNDRVIKDTADFHDIWNSIEEENVLVEYIYLNEGKVRTDSLVLNSTGFDLNIDPGLQNKVVFSNTLEGLPASRAGIKPRDILLSINDAEVFYQDAEEFVDYLEQQAGQELKFTVLNSQGGIEDLYVHLQPKQGDEPILGAQFQINAPIEIPLYYLDYSDNKLMAGVFHTINIFGYNPAALAEIIAISFETRDVELASQSVSSVWGVGEQLNVLVVNRDYQNIINLVGLISVALAFMNILPIPLLDGGQVLFLFIEKIKGSPISLKTQERIAKISFTTIIVFSVLIILKDIWLGFIGDFVRDIL